MFRNQRGFGLTQILLIILLVGAITGAGYYVYNSNTKQDTTDSKAAITNFDECVAAGNPVMESFPEQCAADGQTFANESQQAVLTLDKENLPQGWYDARVESDIITLDNSAIDREPAESCLVEFHHVHDDAAKGAEKSTFSEKQRMERAQSVKDDKGYETELLPESKITVLLNGAEVELPGFYELVTLPASEYGRYQKSAYIVRDGEYVSVVESCQGNDFTQADETVLAVSIRI